VRYLTAGLMALTLLAVACGARKPSAEEQAVREAIRSHLNQQRGLALNNMKMDFESVTIRGDTAQAQVRFQSVEKPSLAVAMTYALRRVGGKWEVESSSPVAGMGADSHQAAETPQGSATAPPAATQHSSPQPQPKPSH
jgi:hypothetical protein